MGDHPDERVWMKGDKEGIHYRYHSIKYAAHMVVVPGYDSAQIYHMKFYLAVTPSFGWSRFSASRM